MDSVIYSIENKINNKKYIGKCENNVENKRWKEHKRALKKGTHTNKHLQNAWNKYGENNFGFEIIEECPIEKLIEKEIFYISYFDTKNNGYNLTDGGEGISGYRHTLSEETKKKMSNFRRGKHLSEETKRRISKATIGKNKNKPAWNKGKTYSEETREKLSQSHKGKIMSEETKKRMSESKKERIVSKKTREKLSEINTGKKLSEETKDKIRNANLGRKFPDSVSSYFGVYKDIRYYGNNLHIYWKARIRLKDGPKNIGTYKTETEAAINYDKYIVEYCLPNPLNFPENYGDKNAKKNIS